MNAQSHPHFVPIPDAATEGLRAYREPAEPHPLQLTFLDPDAEQAWVTEIAELLNGGRADEADARLSAELAGFDGKLARLCQAATPATVHIEGWDDLLPILAEWEGPPVTAITIGLTNPPDLAFEPGANPEPELLIGLYSDDCFPFSRAGKADILAECGKDLPAWVNADEDVEFYCTVRGLADLNAALIHWKHRHFLRDGRDGVEGRAPGGYVEYVLGNWLRATRFLQAVQRAVAEHGTPDGARIIAGTVEINADFVAVLGDDRGELGTGPKSASAEPSFATLTVKPWVPREDPTAETFEPAATLRQRLAVAEPEPAARPGLFKRLFGRLRRS